MIIRSGASSTFPNNLDSFLRVNPVGSTGLTMEMSSTINKYFDAMYNIEAATFNNYPANIISTLPFSGVSGSLNTTSSASSLTLYTATINIPIVKGQSIYSVPLTVPSGFGLNPFGDASFSMFVHPNLNGYDESYNPYINRGMYATVNGAAGLGPFNTMLTMPQVMAGIAPNNATSGNAFNLYLNILNTLPITGGSGFVLNEAWGLVNSFDSNLTYTYGITPTLIPPKPDAIKAIFTPSIGSLFAGHTYTLSGAMLLTTKASGGFDLNQGLEFQIQSVTNDPTVLNTNQQCWSGVGLRLSQIQNGVAGYLCINGIIMNIGNGYGINNNYYRLILLMDEVLNIPPPNYSDWSYPKTTYTTYTSYSLPCTSLYISPQIPLCTVQNGYGNSMYRFEVIDDIVSVYLSLDGGNTWTVDYTVSLSSYMNSTDIQTLNTTPTPAPNAFPSPSPGIITKAVNGVNETFGGFTLNNCTFRELKPGSNFNVDVNIMYLKVGNNSNYPSLSNWSRIY